MDKDVLIALISAIASILVAIIGIIPEFRERQGARTDSERERRQRRSRRRLVTGIGVSVLLLLTVGFITGIIQVPPGGNAEPTETAGACVEYEPLPDCATSRLHRGDTAYVSVEGGPNAIRSEPDTRPDDNIVGKAQEGEKMEIVGGPECNLGWVLWEVETETGLQGWTPEGNGEEYWLVPDNPACE